MSIFKVVLNKFIGGPSKTDADPGTSISICLAGRINPEDNFKLFSSQFAPLLARNARNISNLAVDLSAADFLYPSALVYILSLRDICKERGVNLSLMVEEGSPVHEYLWFCGMATYFELPSYPTSSPRNIDSAEVAFRLYYETAISDPYSLSIELFDYLNKDQFLARFNASQIIDSIDEVLRNIRQHSGFTRFSLLAQTFPRSRRLRVVAFDNGIGIRRHLTRLPYKSTHPHFQSIVEETLYDKMKIGNARTAIKYAAVEMVSGTNYSVNSGAGLAFLTREFCSSNGQVAIISEDGCVSWSAGQEKPEAIRMPVVLPGTMICMTVTCD